MPTQKITLSIVITAHNSEATIKNTLLSLVGALSDYINECEVILINDASTDTTEAELMGFTQYVQQAHYYKVEYKNIGKVRDFAISKCKGEYITMLDGDDLLKERSLPEIIDFLKINSPDMLLTKLHEVRDITVADTSWKGLETEKLSIHEAITRFLQHKDFQAHLIGQFIKNSILQTSLIPSFICYEDFYVFPELLKKSKKIIFSRSSHYLYIKRSSSLSSVPSSEKMDNLFTCTERMEDIFGQEYQNLIVCHWIDIKLKHEKWIESQEQLSLLKEKVKEAYTIGFFLSPLVSFNYKRKAVELLWKK